MAERKEVFEFDGGAGLVDCVMEWPEGSPRGWALVLHPHPLHGGARDNKVVTTISRACLQHGLVAVRPNFRGVGKSEGCFDQARGETDDMGLLVDRFRATYPEVFAGQWVLAGFSFGTSVAAQLYSSLQGTRQPDALILAGPAVERFKFREIVVPEDTLVVHGELDEVVPLSEAMDFARGHGLPVSVIPDASHFFHGKLLTLRMLVQQRLKALGLAPYN